MQENSRRKFLKKSVLLTLGTIAAPSLVKDALAGGGTTPIAPADNMKYTLPALPYAYDALEPHIDKMTMEIHHSKHHQAYITNLNKALEGLDKGQALKAQSMDDIFKNMSSLPVAVRNNGGGHYNHSLFWTLMKPASATAANAPKGKLSEAINNTFGSLDEFKKQFSDAAMKRFGSGWAWLVKTAEGKLVISSTANQDNPLMNLDSVEVKGAPILALDVWEHAYYLKNQNKRADYIASWWNVVNWEKAEGLFEESAK